ncbi:MAG: CocE/NonD family hydrolase [Coleofasciculaceae cyanobacterium]
MLTRDGIKLDADIYRPDAEGEFPVLLMRQPYGRAIASTVVYAHPTWYAAQGYIVVIQDVRGRGTSEGEFRLFSNETADGADSINWVASLPGSTGKVGMYGFSYQAMTQLYAATTKPAALKTICPAMMAYDLYADWAYEGGAFCLQTNLGWAIQLSAETARLQGDTAAYQTLYKASRSLPSHPEPDLMECLRKFAPNAFYHQWLEHSKPDSYWEKLSPKGAMQVDLPMLHIGGWFDTYLRGNIRLYKDIAGRSGYRQQLLIGPWTHLPWCRKVGAVDFGNEAINPIDKLQIRWFDQFLKEIDTGLLDEAPICLFEMGSNFWRKFNTFPNNNHQAYFLSSNGLASIREDDGILITNKPKSCTDDILVHDPWRPVPTLGGHAAIPAGCFERSHLDYRSDVLTYTTKPLAALHIAGEIVVEIWCNSDKPSHDLCAVLSEVHPDGKAYNLTQGYLHVETSQNDVALQILLQATCAKITQGNALRLSISAACFPAYALNFGTGKSEANLIDAEIITLSVSCGGNRASRMLLPVVSLT